MYTVSTKWQRSIRESHTVIFRADIYPAGGPPIVGVPIVAGSVQVDATAAVRRTLQSCVLADPTGQLIPIDATSALAPYGSMIRPYRGIQYPDGSTELMPLGVFLITDADASNRGTPTLTVEGSDFSWAVARNKFTDPYVIGAGQNYGDAIAALADNRHGGDTQLITPTEQTTPLIVIDVQEDPWQHLADMAGGFGFEVLYDQDGAFVLRRVHDPTDDQIVVAFATGDNPLTMLGLLSTSSGLPAAANLVDTDRKLSVDPGYNGVVMVAESTTLPTPLRTVLFDMDPASPTYALGPYGMVPAFQSSPFITTQDGCDAAATAWLSKNLGGTEDVTFDIIPDPALDADDVVRVIDDRIKLDTIGVIQSLTIPLSITDSMPITLRPRQILVTS